jgi:restriction endonuclease S subunit
MQAPPNIYLHFIPFKNLVNWSVQYTLDTNFSYVDKYELVEIGIFLKRNKTPIDIESNKEYKRVTIKINNGGVFLRDIEKGINIGTKRQFIVSEGQFLLSKIDARNGAFGVVPQELTGAIVTNDFPVYDINTDIILPQFLQLITTTKEFVKFAQSCSSGTTNRQRMDIDKFITQKIPLPSLLEQTRIVNNYNNNIVKAETLKQQANDLEREVEEYLFEQLMISKKPLTQNKKEIFSLCSFSDLYRWDIPYLKNEINARFKSSYDLIKLSEIISHFNKDESDRSLRVETKHTPEQYFRYIGMENVEKNTGSLLINLEDDKIKGDKIKSQTIKVPKDFIIYGKLRPYLNKYWLNNSDYQDIVCSSEFFVFKIKHFINNSFFINVLGSDIVQKQIQDLYSGARMPRINESVFMNIQIPLPQLPIQEKIASHIQNMRKQIRTFRKSAENKTNKAIIEFEKEIFN